jgi:predicted DNA-binding protein
MSEPSDSAARGSMELEKMVKALADKTGKSYDTISNFLFGGKKATPAEFEEGVEKPMKEYTSNTMSEPSDSAARGSEELEKTVKALADKTGKTYDAISNFLFGGKKATPAEFEEGVQTDLNEALQAVKILKNQLQEVNLLNAKLLYVNKVFKSNNLSEGQKVNVIAAFDKAETVKEVKLVFETVSKNVVAKPTTIKEHRSFASKATGNAQTTAPKEILSEVSDQVARWQKLAGIIKS